MPTLEELQDRHDRLTREIDRQNELRDSGSDDYDFDALDRAFNERNHVRRAIEEAGGTPGGTPPTPEAPGGSGEAGGTGGTPSTTGDPAESTVDQLRNDLERLRDNPPHPGVRVEDGQVVGGTEADLQEQLEWRARIDRLQHELTAAEADQAWAAAGGPDGFTEAELQAVEQASGRIDGIQERLDAVNARIAEKETALDEAAGVMRGQQTQGGGPNAASGAAVAVGARLQGELRELYRDQAAIVQELNAALEALGTIIRNRVRAQLEGGDVGVGLPTDRKGQEAVEDAFLRRVYRRLGLPYRPVGAGGLLRGLSGAQSRGSDRRPLLVALAVLVLLLALGGLFLALRSDDDGQVATGTGDETVSDESTDEVEVSVDGGTDGAEEVVEPPVEATPPVASGVYVAYACPTVQHTPLPGFPGSLSFFELDLLVAGVDGPIPPGSTLMVDAGGLAPNAAPVDGATAVVPIPIDSFGSYPVTSITATGPDGPLPVEGALPDIVVGADEGPVGGCPRPEEVLDGGIDTLLGSHPDQLFLGDTLLGGPPSPGADPSGPPDFEGFVADVGAAHGVGDADTLFDLLGQATLDRYGADQCRAYLGEVVGTLSDPVLLAVEPKDWVYETDGRRTEIPDAWGLELDLVLGGSPTQATMHVRQADDGGLRWFTDCGEPID